MKKELDYQRKNIISWRIKLWVKKKKVEHLEIDVLEIE